MLISKLVEKLLVVKEKIGDVPVVVDDSILDLWEVVEAEEGSILGCFLNNAEVTNYDVDTPCVVLA